MVFSFVTLKRIVLRFLDPATNKRRRSFGEIHDHLNAESYRLWKHGVWVRDSHAAIAELVDSGCIVDAGHDCRPLYAIKPVDGEVLTLWTEERPRYG